MCEPLGARVEGEGNNAVEEGGPAKRTANMQFGLGHAQEVVVRGAWGRGWEEGVGVGLAAARRVDQTCDARRAGNREFAGFRECPLARRFRLQMDPVKSAFVLMLNTNLVQYEHAF